MFYRNDAKCKILFHLSGLRHLNVIRFHPVQDPNKQFMQKVDLLLSVTQSYGSDNNINIFSFFHYQEPEQGYLFLLYIVLHHFPVMKQLTQHNERHCLQSCSKSVPLISAEFCLYRHSLSPYYYQEDFISTYFLYLIILNGQNIPNKT